MTYNKLRYFDNAATSYKKPSGMYESMCQNISNPGRGTNSMSVFALKKMHDIRVTLARYFSVVPNNIAICSGLTLAMNMVLNGLLQKGDHVIATTWEHNSVLRPLHFLSKNGVKVTYIKPEKIDKVKVQKNTKCIVFSAASNVTGNKNDIFSLCKFAKDNSIIPIIDSAQYAGLEKFYMPSDKYICCFSGHKALLGAMGSGGIIVKGDIEFKPTISGGSGYNTYDMEIRDFPGVFEMGTPPMPALMGLNYSVNHILNNEEYIYEGYKKNKDYFYNNLKKIKNVKIYSNGESRQIVALNIADINSSEVERILSDKFNIIVRGGSHCAPLMHKELGTVEQGIVRFSFAYDDDISDIDYALNAIEYIASKKP